MDYRIHYYCSRCRQIYRRRDLKMEIPLCQTCGKMLRRGARKKKQEHLKYITLQP